MLFKVIYEGKKHTVYSVMQNSIAGECKFLIYDGGFLWRWVKASKCALPEE